MIGMLCSLYANSKSDKKFSIYDFMPNTEEPETTFEELINKYK